MKPMAADMTSTTTSGTMRAPRVMPKRVMRGSATDEPTAMTTTVPAVAPMIKAGGFASAVSLAGAVPAGSAVATPMMTAASSRPKRAAATVSSARLA